MRGATEQFEDLFEAVQISTHAPRAGSDFVTEYVAVPPIQFQPTLPVRGATRL